MSCRIRVYKENDAVVVEIGDAMQMAHFTHPHKLHSPKRLQSSLQFLVKILDSISRSSWSVNIVEKLLWFSRAEHKKLTKMWLFARFWVWFSCKWGEVLFYECIIYFTVWELGSMTDDASQRSFSFYLSQDNLDTKIKFQSIFLPRNMTG